MEIFIEDGGKSYKLVVTFDDIMFSQGSHLGGGQLNSILLQLKFSPRIYQRLSGTRIKPKFISDRYHICKEDFQYVLLRTSDFSPTKALGLSSYFCLKLEVVSLPLKYSSFSLLQ
ncbi:RNA-dependent RNA polymerase 2 [Platanthera zijinensis]|uniref:RNA-dependent RNA polymerase 2 n=1 Tax=Platanthera zijinensis TaxID=2320716 RepID=A0AAP0C0N1_9ASPA